MRDELRERARGARVAIANGMRGPALRALLDAIPSMDRDAFVDEMLGLGEPPDDGNLPRGAVPYLPSGVDEILAAVDEAPIRATDAVVDLGAGLGRVAILVHLLSGAATSGIEIQAPLVARATAGAASLGLSIPIVCADAGDCVLDGSVFYLYAPFNGALLARVCDRLAEVARRRRIVICSVGFELGASSWLRARPTRLPSLTIHESDQLAGS